MSVCEARGGGRGAARRGRIGAKRRRRRRVGEVGGRMIGLLVVVGWGVCWVGLGLLWCEVEEGCGMWVVG